MNKKIIPIVFIASSLLLVGCGKGKKPGYEYPDNPTTISFDYSYNDSLKTELENMYLVNNQELTTTQLSHYLEVISKNDFYANKVEYKKIEKELYLAENDTNYIAGDFDYLETREITRDNDKNSLSGSIAYDTKNWVKNTDTNQVDLVSEKGNGTYSLVPNEKTEIGTETIDCDNDKFDSIKSIGYSQQLWSNQMNLTQSAKIGQKFKDVIKNAETKNETLPLNRQYVTTIKSYVSYVSSSVVLTSVAKALTTAGTELQVKYTVSVSVAGGMIVQTLYQYTEMEIVDETEYFLKGEVEERNLYHI